jgi:hypothetical protein
MSIHQFNSALGTDIILPLQKILALEGESQSQVTFFIINFNNEAQDGGALKNSFFHK